jgi:hypothetical protein
VFFSVSKSIDWEPRNEGQGLRLFGFGLQGMVVVREKVKLLSRLGGDWGFEGCIMLVYGREFLLGGGNGGGERPIGRMEVRTIWLVVEMEVENPGCISKVLGIERR